MVDIKGLDKAQVLKALYDNSHPKGLGFLQAGETITVEQCDELLKNFTYFDYLGGRVLKVELSGDEFDERLYDRDNGEGAAQRAVDSIKGAPEGSAHAAKETDGEKKELATEEKAMLVEDTIRKILDILKELPPDASFAASVMLKMNLPGPPIGGLAGVMMINGALAPSPSTTFPVSEPKEWDIISPPFPFKSRFG